MAVVEHEVVAGKCARQARWSRCPGAASCSLLRQLTERDGMATIRFFHEIYDNVHELQDQGTPSPTNADCKSSSTSTYAP